MKIQICLPFQSFSKQFNPLKVYINRYLRYFPAVALLVLFFASSLPRFIIDGPHFSELTYNAYKCKKWWWSSFLFIQNYANNNENCLNHTWYLSADFQLFLLTPVIVCVLRKYGRKFVGVIVAVIVLLQCLTFYELNQ